MADDLVPTHHFDGSRDHTSPADRLRHVRRAAQALREELMSREPVRFYASLELIRVPYPLAYALRDAVSAPGWLVHIVNRLFVVQLDTAAGVKSLLLSPSDVERNTK